MKDYQFAIVRSTFNAAVTHKLLEGAQTRCRELQMRDTQYRVFTVPGVVEIPVVAQSLAASQAYDAIICLGAVIRGETSHYDFVCQQVSYGCQRVALDHSLPVIFGILTTENLAQALDRVGGAHGHKGKEAIDTAVMMVDTLLEVG